MADEPRSSANLESCVSFLRNLIQTKSLPGAEGEIAQLMRSQMERLGYHEVSIDEVGNVIGTIRGRGTAPPLIFNTHLDHVDVGDHSTWPHPPFGGEIHDNRVWGRGAVDIKGPLAAQVIGVARLLHREPPDGDVHVTAVVQEEIGGVGARHMVEHLKAPVVVVGEPSANQIRRGHRGRSELLVTVHGRSVHASAPTRGINPLFSLGRLLSRLHQVEHASHPELGCSTVAPTLISTDQTSANVVPGKVELVCDWRTVPGESAEQARQALEKIAVQSAEPQARVEVTIPSYPRRTYTGQAVSIPADNPAYVLPTSHRAVDAAQRIASQALGHETPVGIWKFATDGGHFAEAGMAPVGFGPGNEALAHTIDEHVEITELDAAIRVNERFASELARLAAES